MSKNSTKKYDVLFFTAIEEEFIALKSLLDRHQRNYSPSPILKSRIEVYEYTSINGSTARLMLACPNKIGQLESAIFATFLFSQFKFSYVAVTGIAGSLHVNPRKNNKFEDRFLYHENLSLGDIIFADKILDVDISRIEKFEQGEKFKKFQRSIRPQKIDIDTKIVNTFRKFSSHKSEIFANIPVENYENYFPNIIVAPMLSTHQIIADKGTARELMHYAESSFNNLHPLGFEMESFAVLRASEYLQPHTKCFVLKAANDFADRHKNDDEIYWRKRALYNASLAAVNFAQHLVDNDI